MGLEAEHVGNLGLASATDESILAEGNTRGAIVVTLDYIEHIACPFFPLAAVYLSCL